MALLILFLVGVSLATGALQVGRSDGGWQLSAFDTRDQCRVRWVFYFDRMPEFRYYSADSP
ncbi:MAG: hypothetical protein WC314_13440 [Vulcanimicrobiota bacterium]